MKKKTETKKTKAKQATTAPAVVPEMRPEEMVWTGDYPKSWRARDPETRVVAIFYQADGRPDYVVTEADTWGLDWLNTGCSVAVDGCEQGKWDAAAGRYDLLGLARMWMRDGDGISRPLTAGSRETRVWLNADVVKSVGLLSEYRKREEPIPDVEGEPTGRVREVWYRDVVECRAFSGAGDFWGCKVLAAPLVKDETATGRERWLDDPDHHGDCCSTVYCNVCAERMLSESGSECGHVVWLDSCGDHCGCGAAENGWRAARDGVRRLLELLPPPVRRLLAADTEGGASAVRLNEYDIDGLTGEIELGEMREVKEGRKLVERWKTWTIQLAEVPEKDEDEVRQAVAWLQSLDGSKKEKMVRYRRMTAGWMAEWEEEMEGTWSEPDRLPCWAVPGYSVVPEWAELRGLAAEESEGGEG